MTEAVLTCEKVKKFAFQELVTSFAAFFAKLPWLAKDFLVSDRPRNGSDGEPKDEKSEKLLPHIHDLVTTVTRENKMRFLNGGK